MSKFQYVSIDDNGTEITAKLPASHGPKPKFHLLRYQNCKLGDSKFIITGKKPHCAWCGKDTLVSCVEIAQPDLFNTVHYDLVVQCENCSQLTVYKYSIGGE